jgi:hypothetical protein
MLPIKCPACNSRNVRSSLSQTFFERVAKAFGFFQLRCRECDTRFTRAIWDALNVIYARCPRCYGLELSLWSPSYYRPPASWKFMMAIGGRPRRCEFCRKNFVSFRPCKIRYRRPRPSNAASSVAR